MGSGLTCHRGCAGCCQDGLKVGESEAAAIREAASTLSADELPHPRGACVFLSSEGACRIYAARPYVCRTQGLPLSWFEEDEEEDLVERRAICELNDPGAPLDALGEDAVWLIGPTELELQRLDREAGDPDTRHALRDLFPDRAGGPHAV